MDARRFSTRQGCLVEKSRRRSGPGARSASGAEAGRAFFGPRFFARAKKGGSHPEGERKPLILLLRLNLLLQEADMRNKSQDSKTPGLQGRCQSMNRESRSLKARLSLLLRRSELLLFARAKRSNQQKRFSNSRMTGQARAGTRSVGLCPPVPCAPRGPGGRRTTRYAQTRAPLRPSARCGARLALRPGKVKEREQQQQQQQQLTTAHYSSSSAASQDPMA